MSHWLKVQCATPDKPEVFNITARMQWDDPDLTVGKLFRVWRWFDQQTLDGHATGVTPELLDRIAGVTGFAAAMAEVGWLEINEEGVSLPNFDHHNGQSAKKRATTAKRVANFRAKNSAAIGEASLTASNAGSVTATVTPNVTTALAREEKIRGINNKKGRSAGGAITEENPKGAQTKGRIGQSSPPAEALSDQPLFDAHASVRLQLADLVAQGLSPQTAKELLDLREQKKAAITPTVWGSFINEVAQLNLTLEEAAQIWIARGWLGFKAEWVESAQPKAAKSTKKTVAKKSAKRAAKTVAEPKQQFDKNDNAGVKSDGTIEL